jgi:hypothetical protein
LVATRRAPVTDDGALPVHGSMAGLRTFASFPASVTGKACRAMRWFPAPGFMRGNESSFMQFQPENPTGVPAVHFMRRKSACFVHRTAGKIMTTEKNGDTKPFPGSPTGNQSGAGASHGGTPGTQEAEPGTQETEKKPTETYPGSPTGNASGVGDTPDAKEKY